MPIDKRFWTEMTAACDVCGQSEVITTSDFEPALPTGWTRFVDWVNGGHSRVLCSRACGRILFDRDWDALATAAVVPA